MRFLRLYVPAGPAVAFCALTSLVAVSGCSRDDAPEGPAPVRPVKTTVVEAPDLGGERKFPGKVDAQKKAELGFRVPGTIQEILVKEGDLVEDGQVLIKLDPTDFEIAVKDAQATYDRAKSDFDRASELVKDGFVSRSDYDAKEGQFKSASASLDRAKQDLVYTELKASFAGTISKRYVERAEEVQAKQPVLAMQDNSTLEVRVDVPETIILSMKPSEDGRPDASRVPTKASFDSRPGKSFDLTLREVSTRADAATQTFEVRFSMDAPKDFVVFPGMTVTVTADLSKVAKDEELFILPAAAVTADEDMKPFVWVLDEPDLKARKVPVDVGRLVGSSIEVEGGLETGNRVVVAGVGYLAEGMQVRLLEQREQAEPRPDEAPDPATVPGASASDS